MTRVPAPVIGDPVIDIPVPPVAPTYVTDPPPLPPPVDAHDEYGAKSTRPTSTHVLSTNLQVMLSPPLMSNTTVLVVSLFLKYNTPVFMENSVTNCPSSP